ncbi:MAG: SLC13 family permease [Thermoprotei archaeon]
MSLALLFGIAAQFRAMHGKKLIERLIGSLSNRVGVLYSTLIVSAALSPLVLNDVVILFLTPVLAEHCRTHPSDAVPLIVAEVTFTNVGSTLTPFGNPQNILLWENSGIGALRFVKGTAPYVLLSGILCALALLVYRRKTSKFTVNWSSDGIIVPAIYLMVLSATIFLLSVLGVENTVSIGIAFVIGFLLNIRHIGGFLREFDVRSLALIYCLIVATTTASFFLGSHIERYTELIADGIQPSSAILMALISNVISNVPATQLVLSSTHVAASGAPLVAVEAGLAGNLTPVGSLANILALTISRSYGLKLKKIVVVQALIGLVSYIPVFLIHFFS